MSSSGSSDQPETTGAGGAAETGCVSVSAREDCGPPAHAPASTCVPVAPSVAPEASAADRAAPLSRCPKTCSQAPHKVPSAPRGPPQHSQRPRSPSSGSLGAAGGCGRGGGGGEEGRARSPVPGRGPVRGRPQHVQNRWSWNPWSSQDWQRTAVPWWPHRAGVHRRGLMRPDMGRTAVRPVLLRQGLGQSNRARRVSRFGGNRPRS